MLIKFFLKSHIHEPKEKVQEGMLSPSGNYCQITMSHGQEEAKANPPPIAVTLTRNWNGISEKLTVMSKFTELKSTFI